MRPFRILASWPTLRFAACLAAALAFAGPAPAAANYKVDSTEDASDRDLRDSQCISTDGRCTLRAAVEQANYLSSRLSLSSTIYLSDEIYTLKTPLVFRGEIRIFGQGERTRIDCQGVPSTLSISGSLELHNLALGSCPDTENRGRLDLQSVQVGRSVGLTAIRNRGVFSALASSFLGNLADSQSPGGAALFNEASGIASLLNSQFEGNFANRHGGVVFNLGSLKVSIARFFQNGASGDGGAIYNLGDLSLELVTFDENDAGNGGALFNAGQASVVQSSFVRNQATGGGAIWSEAPLQLVNSTVSGNAALLGGGLYGSGEPNVLYLANSTITQNSATFREMGTSGLGGGLYGAAILRNTILARNKSAVRGQDCHDAGPTSQPHSQGYNIIGILDDCSLLLDRGDRAGSRSKPLDPRLLPLDETTWYPPFHGLDGSSPAVDHGDPRGCRMPLTETLLSADQLEETRHQGAACDAGSIELRY